MFYPQRYAQEPGCLHTVHTGTREFFRQSKCLQMQIYLLPVVHPGYACAVRALSLTHAKGLAALARRHYVHEDSFIRNYVSTELKDAPKRRRRRPYHIN